MPLWAILSRVLGLIISLPIHLYCLVISPLKPRTCRYTPSCSRYFLAAIRIRGPVVGTILGIYRLLRCQPFGGSGDDPVPTKGWRRQEKADP